MSLHEDFQPIGHVGRCGSLCQRPGAEVVGEQTRCTCDGLGTCSLRSLRYLLKLVRLKRERGKCPLPPSSMALIRQRWAAASYTRAGQDWRSLFDRHDTDGSGEMDMGEMKALFRRVMRIPPRDVSDNDIAGFGIWRELTPLPFASG